jgi:Trypsin/Bacterial Ig domain
MSRALIILVALCASLIGCGEEPAIDVNSVWSSITNGKSTSGYPSVGALSGCTATLVGKKTVLTAAHCVQNGGTYGFTVGGAKYSGKAVRHPKYTSWQQIYDIALIILTQAPPVTPTPIANMAPTVGTEVTLVGYGVTSEYGKDSGIKRMAKNTIASLTTTEFIMYGSGGAIGNTCYGDSGGPAFATLNGNFVVVGVTSRGNFCGKDGTDTRVDAYKDWVAQNSNNDALQAGTTPPKPADGEAPKVVITSPLAGEALKVGQASVKVSATDNVGVTKVELVVGTTPGLTLNAAPWDFQVQLAAGTQTLSVRAHDDAGNTSQAAVTVIVSDAVTPPPPVGPPDPPDPGKPPSPPAPPSPGSFGATCSSNADCTSGLCGEDPQLGSGKFCTQSCTPGAAGCPLGGTVLQDE